MYVYCRDCKWDNGDYGYNSFSYKFKEGFKDLNPFELMTRKKRINNRWYKVAIPYFKTNKWGDKQYIHILKLQYCLYSGFMNFKYAFINLIEHIGNRKFYTIEEFEKKNPNHECPICKSKNLSVD